MLERIRRRPIRWGSAAAAVVLGAVVVWALIGLIRMPGHAQSAVSDLREAKRLVGEGSTAQALAAAESAVDEAASARGAASNPVAKLLGYAPVIGSAFGDADHLTSALVEITEVGRDGIAIVDQVSRDPKHFVDDRQVHLEAISAVSDRVSEMQRQLTTARTQLESVEGTAPRVGQRIAKSRDEALEQLEPALSGIARADGVLSVLPAMLGSERRRFYVLTVLNPSEMRYSGGANLTLGRVVADKGRIKVLLRDNYAPVKRTYRSAMRWRPVHDNPFHSFLWQRLAIIHATMNPNWSISGEELRRAFRQQTRGTDADGVIALDIQAVTGLMSVTGEISVPGYPELTPENVVTELVGSYDKYSDWNSRHVLNRALITAFRDQLFAADDLRLKLQSLATAAKKREFAVHLVDPHEQVVMDDLGLQGDLSDTDHDYVGNFTQTLVGAKSEFWSTRTLESNVRLAANGSATVTQKITILNDSPPFAQPGVDPGDWYFTRWATYNLGSWLPKGARVRAAAVDGNPVKLTMQSTKGRPFVQFLNNRVPSQGSRVFTLTYSVPHAAVVQGNTMRYHLSYDPQSTVVPPQLKVRVTYPRGFTSTAVRDGWVTQGRRASYESSAAVESAEWETVATRQ